MNSSFVLYVYLLLQLQLQLCIYFNIKKVVSVQESRFRKEEKQSASDLPCFVFFKYGKIILVVLMKTI